MPGPVSDSYDPEFGTTANAHDIRSALQGMHGRLGAIIGGPPKPILDVVRGDEGRLIDQELTERQWRLLRFACERAGESL